MSEGDLDRACRRRGAGHDIAFKRSESALDRSLQEQIAKWNLSSNDRNAGGADADQHGDGMYQNQLLLHHGQHQSRSEKRGRATSTAAKSMRDTQINMVGANVQRGFDVVIRDAKYVDIHAMTFFLQEGYARSHYAKSGIVNVDVNETKRLLGAGLGRHGHKGIGACWLQVADNDGSIDGLMYATLARVYGIGDRLMATDLFWVTSERARRPMR